MGRSAAPTGPVRVNDAATLVAGGAPVQIQSVTPDGAEWAWVTPAELEALPIPDANRALVARLRLASTTGSGST